MKETEKCVVCFKEKPFNKFMWVLKGQNRIAFGEKLSDSFYYYCSDECLTKWARRKQW